MKQQEILKEWKKRYKAKYRQDYIPPTSAFYELKLIKQTLEEHDGFVVMLSIHRAMKNGCRTIPDFLERIEDYLPDTEHPELMYYILFHGGPKQQKAWKSLVRNQDVWFPSPKQLAENRAILKSLYHWMEGKRIIG